MLPYFKENIAYNLFRLFSRANKILSIVKQIIGICFKKTFKQTFIHMATMTMHKQGFLLF